MASNKNPSIYYDRSTIGSSEELDEYGVWVKSEPQDLSSVMDTRETVKPEEDFFPELAGDAPDINVIKADPWVSESPADMTDMMDLADFNISSADGALFNEDLGFMAADTETEYVEMEPLSLDAKTEEQMPAIESEDVLEEENPSDISMADFFPEPENENVPPPPPPLPEISEQKTRNAGDLSTQLLMKIAEELSSIRDELSSLKQELYQSKHPAVEPEEQNVGGFFDEEEDEKIALTGDELNTILNTADFTAEAGASDQEEVFESEPLDLIEEMDAESSEAPDFSEQLLEPDVAFFAGIDAAMEDLPAIDDSFIFPAENMEIPPDMEMSEELEIPPEMEISPELEMLRENGVEPMTSLSEDIDFLEEIPADTNLPFLDLLEDDSLTPSDTSSVENSSFDTSLDDSSSFDDGSSFDFEDAVIEEPDLKGELKENPIEEPSLDNLSLELDMELLSEEDETMELPDSGSDSTDANEEIELHLEDSGDSNELVSGEFSDEFSPNDGLLDTADISIDDLLDVSPAEEAPENIGDTLDDDAYDQVIPEGFLIESGDSPAQEQNILGDGGVLENTDDSLADPFVLEDILETEDFAKDGSVDLESISEDLEPVSEELELIPEEPELVLEEAEPVLEEPEAEEASVEEEVSIEEEDNIAPVAELPAEEDRAGISEPANVSPQKQARKTDVDVDVSTIPSDIKLELRSVLSYMDQLLESLPENKIEEFAKSEYFDTYKKLFEDLGLA
jgi:hypothetical protein